MGWGEGWGGGGGGGGEKGRKRENGGKKEEKKKVSGKILPLIFNLKELYTLIIEPWFSKFCTENLNSFLTHNGGHFQGEKAYYLQRV